MAAEIVWDIPITDHHRRQGSNLAGQNWLESVWFDVQYNPHDWEKSYSTVSFGGVWGVGKLQGVEVKNYVEEGASQTFEKSWFISFTIHGKVKKELRRQALGIIQQVWFADFAAPIVPVLKSNGIKIVQPGYRNTVFPILRRFLHPSLEVKHFPS